MARTNKFATQNLNDIYGKKEPKPAPPDNGNSAGIRARASSSSHGGMLVLRPPVKQPPSFHFKTTTAGLKSEAAPSVVQPSAPPLVSTINSPVSSPNPPNLNDTDSSANNSNNKQQLLPEGDGSNPGSTVSPEAITKVTEIVSSVENSKAEHSDSISLRPNRRPEFYTPHAARTLTTENATLEKTITCTVETVAVVANPFTSDPAQPVLERETVESKEEAAPEVVKAVRPEPFRPPHLRGDGARRLELATAGSSSPNPHPPPPPPPREDSNPGHGWSNRGGGFHQRMRREETEGRYSRDAPHPPSQQRYDRDERGGGGYFNRQNNSFSPAYSRPAPEPVNYDIEIIRPGSGGNDIYDINNNAINNNREFGYGGREGFERQMMSPPANLYWGEGHPNYDMYDHRQDFDRQEGSYRRNYNNNNNNHYFKPGGMNRDFQSRDGYGYGGPRREPYGRNSSSMNPFMGAAGQFAQAPANNNGRFSGQPREQYSRMHRDGTHRYGGGYQRPRSGGYEGVPSRPRSSGFGARSMGSSDSMVSRPNFYNGLRSPVSQERAGHQEFGPHGRYHYDGPNEIQNVDVGYYRPTSGGYRGHATGRSMASSDNMVSRPHKYNGSMSPVSRNKMDSENFSNRTHEPYHLEGSFSPYEEVDSYRTRGEVNNGESNLEGEHQKVAWDSSTEYNLLNLESSEVIVKSDPRLNVDQRFYVEGRRQYYTEEEKRVEDVREEIMEQGQLAQGISVPNRQDEGVVQEMRKEVAEDVINREANFESFDPHIAFQETSGQFKEEHNPPNVDSGLKEQDKLADRFASSKITANRTHRPFQNDSVSSMRSSNYHAGRDGVPQSNSYASRSSAMSWRREPNEMRNGSFRRFSSQHGDNNYRPGSRDSTRSDRYQF